MTKNKAAKKRHRKADLDQRMVIEIKRHLSGPPRRSPGQTLQITRKQIRQQGLKNGRDYRVIKTAP